MKSLEKFLDSVSNRKSLLQIGGGDCLLYFFTKKPSHKKTPGNFQCLLSYSPKRFQKRGFWFL